MCLEEPPTTSLLARATSHPSLAAKEKKSDSSQKPIQSSFEDCSYKSSKDKPIQYQVKIIPRFLGFILCLCLLLHGPASWLSSSEFQNCVWKKIEIAAKPAQNLALQPTELQQTKVNFPYDVASGSSVYCNGDPVNGLDPDGRCVEWANNNNVGTRINGAAQGGLGALGAVGASPMQASLIETGGSATIRL